MPPAHWPTYAPTDREEARELIADVERNLTLSSAVIIARSQNGAGAAYHNYESKRNNRRLMVSCFPNGRYRGECAKIFFWAEEI